jgi:hypothetical protein
MTAVRSSTRAEAAHAAGAGFSRVLPWSTARNCQKVGDREYIVLTNSSPLTVEGLNAMPIHTLRARQFQQIRKDGVLKNLSQAALHLDLGGKERRL